MTASGQNHDRKDRGMTTEDKAELAREAFTLGFMMSREGWNAECAYEHCYEGLQPYYETVDEYRKMTAESWAFQDALEKAFDMLGIGPE